MLYGVGAFDAPTDAAVGAGLFVISLAACLAPMRDALRLDHARAAPLTDGKERSTLA